MILKFRRIFIGFIFCFCVLLGGTSVRAQTSAFTYQGKLTDNAMAANGTYQIQFGLFDAVSGGAQISSTVINPTVNVSNGVFTVNLDFGAAAFSGANRFLQISVFSTATNAFVDLNPRQQITSAPYAVKSANAAVAETATNAANLGNLPASAFVKTDDSRLSDSRSPTAGSVNYIQNQNASAQASANFNISGDGTSDGTLSGNAVNSATQYNIEGNRVLSVGGFFNTVVGINAGRVNTGSNNSFFGEFAGSRNTTGDLNSFFGSSAGGFCDTANCPNPLTGVSNSFFGNNSGFKNTTGNRNSFVGSVAGLDNTTGSNNSFVGTAAGFDNTTGSNNSFFGETAGSNNDTGGNNTAIGAGADFSVGNLNFATAVGAGALASTSNMIVLGRNNGNDFVRVPGIIVLSTLGGNGNTPLCRNIFNQISTCPANLAKPIADEARVPLDTLRQQNALLLRESERQKMLIENLRAVVCELKPQAAVCKEVNQ